MKVLIIHNSYQQPGGEDVVVSEESRLLESQGHTVVRYERSNHEIERMSNTRRLLMVKDIVYSGESKREIGELLFREKPELVHVHNTFMMISPSVYEACREANTPIIQTLHNFRLLCPGWNLCRGGKVCEECIEAGLWRGVWHGCYRNSHVMTGAVALMLQFHRIRGTWNNSVDGYVVLSEFARQKFIDSGLPAEKIHVKPNFVCRDPGAKEQAGKYALFVGRLSPEKGIENLIAAWGKTKIPIPLVVVGDGPLRKSMESEVASQYLSAITFRGWLTREETLSAMKQAAFMVTPSVWYEGFPISIAEAFACGTPVLCSRLGGMREIVEDKRTGLHFNAGDAEDLAAKVEWAWSQPERMAEMGRAARKEYEVRYTAEKNYSTLMQIYERTMRACARN